MAIVCGLPARVYTASPWSGMVASAAAKYEPPSPASAWLVEVSPSSTLPLQSSSRPLQTSRTTQAEYPEQSAAQATLPETGVVLRPPSAKQAKPPGQVPPSGAPCTQAKPSSATPLQLSSRPLQTSVFWVHEPVLPLEPELPFEPLLELPLLDPVALLVVPVLEPLDPELADALVPDPPEASPG
jgi:hypothetical protein